METSCSETGAVTATPARARIGITGIGPWTAAHRGREAFWGALRGYGNGNGNGSAGAAATGSVAVEDLKLPRKLWHADRVGKLALGAVELAMADAEIEAGSELGHDIGIALGTGYGCLGSNAEYLQAILSKGPRFGNPIVFQNTVPNAATGYVSVGWGLRGPTATFSSGCVAGLEALDFAAQQIAEKRCPAMVACAADELSTAAVEVWNARHQLTASGRPRPCDRHRDGTALAEGGCALLLEDLAGARRRGASVYAEYVASGRGFSARPAKALATAIERALAPLTGGAEEIDAVFLAASGDRRHDADCAEGLRLALGDRCAEMPITSTKGMLAETMASAGGFDAAAAALALKDCCLPPIHHASEVDPKIDLRLVLGTSMDAELKQVLITALGDDGNAFATVLRKFQP